MKQALQVQPLVFLLTEYVMRTWFLISIILSVALLTGMPGLYSFQNEGKIHLLQQDSYETTGYSLSRNKWANTIHGSTILQCEKENPPGYCRFPWVLPYSWENSAFCVGPLQKRLCAEATANSTGGMSTMWQLLQSGVHLPHVSQTGKLPCLWNVSSSSMQSFSY
ncbi:MAG: hypothetical protein PHI97_16895 [Desulfobulbus sp.]|nr:hypothetical protein [Desulfobulbus sp.]